jgi:branched-chain amino acid aminotransferase
LAELVSADEIVMTSTTAGVRPIVEIDGRTVGDGTRGPVTASLQAAYADLLATIRRG